ncbi:MAG TPA: chloride channel protein [Solirubrobacteraceae bacterium]|jgi:H+/Cl- antiporter ClcA|nr:chloride channel protein [Solirubrobacteraceae bacterium]
MPEPTLTPEQLAATIRSRRFVVLLLVAAIAGVVVSLAAWCFLELVNQIQRGVYVHLPSDLGYHHGPPLWWPLPVLVLAGLIVAFAIERMPGAGGHVPAYGLSSGGGPTLPNALPGVVLAGLATIGLGVVLGPEAPLIALGSGLGVLTIRLARRDAPPEVVTVLAAAGMFAAASFLFQSPLIAAILMIEVVGLGGPRLTLVLIPGLLAAGIGSLVSLGMGSWTGLSTSAYALGSVEGLAHFARPDIADFGWTIALALAVALVCVLMVGVGRRTIGIVAAKRFVMLPAVGVIVAALAIAFQQITGKPFQEVLFSGQAAIPGLSDKALTWSIGTLALLVLFKAVAYAISLGSFRGGPTFPGLFLGAVAGLMAGQLPGFAITPAVAVGMAAAVAAVLRLPLSAIVIATVLTSGSGAGSGPLVIVGTIVAYIVSVTLLAPPPTAATAPTASATPAPVPGAPAPSQPATT